MNKTFEVVCVVFPASEDATKRLKQSQKTFYLLSSSVTAEWSSVLCLCSFMVSPVRSNQLDALFSKHRIKRFTVIGAISVNASEAP